MLHTHTHTHTQAKPSIKRRRLRKGVMPKGEMIQGQDLLHHHHHPSRLHRWRGLSKRTRVRPMVPFNLVEFYSLQEPCLAGALVAPCSGDSFVSTRPAFHISYSISYPKGDMATVMARNSFRSRRVSFLVALSSSYP
jgi:hypothetical protein